MEINLLRQEIEIEETILSEGAALQVRAEAMVPGAGREGVEILLCDASFTPTGTRLQTGSVRAEGVVRCQAAYRLGAGETRALSASADCQYVFESEKLRPEMTAYLNGRVEQVSARYENGRVLFTAAVVLSVSVTRIQPTGVVSQLGGVDGAEAMYTEICSLKVNAIAEKDVELSEDVALPTAIDARTALMDWATVQLDALEKDPDGIRVAGRVLSETLVSGGTESKPLAIVKYALPFEQVLEMPEWLTDQVNGRAVVAAQSAEIVEGSDGGVALRLKETVRLSVRSIGKSCATALIDAYQTGENRIAVEQTTLRALTNVEESSAQTTIKGTLMLPDGAGAAGSVPVARALATVGEINTGERRTEVSGIVDVAAIYQTAGAELGSVSGEVPFTLEIPAIVPEGEWLDLRVDCVEANALMSDRIEVKLALSVVCRIDRFTDFTIVSNVEETEGVRSPGGFVMYWPTEGETLWSLGKKYGISIDRLRRLNGGAEGVRQGHAIVLRLSPEGITTI